jgi:hypothetical protein
VPATYVNNFGFSGSAQTVTPVWLWENTDDAGLVAYMEVNSSGWQADFTVDRSSPDVLLCWQKYEFVSGGSFSPTGAYDSIAIASGDYLDPIAPQPYNPDGPNSAPEVVDIVGRWQSDQYGRPFDLNDLLA